MSSAYDRYLAAKSGQQPSSASVAVTSAEVPSTTTTGGSSAYDRYLAAKNNLNPSQQSVSTDAEQNNLSTFGSNILNETFGLLGGLASTGYALGAETLGRIAHPITKGIPGVKSDIGQVADLGQRVVEGGLQFGDFLSHPIKDTKEAYDAFLKLRQLPEGQARKAINNFDQAIMQSEEIPLLSKIIGGAGLGVAETFAKLGTDFKSTIANEPLTTTLNLLTFGDMTGLNSVVKASAKSLGAVGTAKMAERFPTVVDGMRDYLKMKALKKTYDAETYARMDEWFDYRNELIKSNNEFFDQNLTKAEKQMYPYYAKGLVEVPKDASENLKLALLKGRELSKLGGEALVRNGTLPRSVLEERKWGPIKARIAFTKYGKTLDQLDEVESSFVNSQLKSVQEGIDPFYYPAIQKNKFLSYLFPSKKLPRSSPGFTKKFTGLSEMNPESFFQSPFQVMTRSQLAVNKYLFDIDSMNKVLTKYGEPVRLGDEIKSGYTVIAPEGYTALINPTKTKADMLESIMTDPNIDFNNSIFGKSLEEVAGKLGVDLNNIATESRDIRFYQVPNFVAKDIQKRITGSAFRQELRNASNVGEVFDAIWGNSKEALLGRQGLRGGIMNLWKKIILGYYPLRWIKNNVIGNMIYSAMEGLNPKDFIESFKIKRGKGVYKELLEATDPSSSAPLVSKLDPIYEEARKYKSAEEFVKNNDLVFQGGEKGTQSEWWTTDINIAREFATRYGEGIKNGGEIRVAKFSDIPGEFRVAIDDYTNTPLSKQDYVKLQTGGKGQNKIITVPKGRVPNTVTLSPESQLTDIWNKANEEINGLSLDQVAQLPTELQPVLKNINRYKTVDGFVRKAQSLLPEKSVEELKTLYTQYKNYANQTLDIQSLPKFERAGPVFEEYKGALLRELGIPENRLAEFLPRGVQSGLGKTEGNRVLRNFYSIEDTSPITQRAFFVFNEGLNWIPNKTFGVNTQIENFFRRASYYHEVSKLAKNALRKTGKEVNAQTILDEVVTNPEMQKSALEQTNKFFGDYLSSTKGAEWIPFVRFYKHIADLAFRYPVEFPGRATLLNQVLDVREQMDEEIRKTSLLPDYLQAENNIPITLFGNKYRMSISSSDPFGALDLTNVKPIPFTGFTPLDTLATALIRQTSPDIKILAERFKQYDLFRQKPFSPDYMVQQGAKEVPDLDEHIKKQIPLFTDARKLVDAIKYWKETGKFEVPARDALGEVMKDDTGKPLYTNSEYLELLKTIGVNLTSEDQYQSQVQKALEDAHDEKIKELEKAKN